ncbi:hypothetical protein M472_21505 [Sphingobacterium paucimobilis HER1398]|uniref:Uncharacterized protein n=1 Tax=Sphingobacterium paucimobilis HER1398 TaxID=1346330 RepID=U2I1D4_9SPHI|nr:hypothetical protein M472_21505 [Sphingobacterium paucimobilis HER1398]
MDLKIIISLTESRYQHDIIITFCNILYVLSQSYGLMMKQMIASIMYSHPKIIGSLQVMMILKTNIRYFLQGSLFSIHDKVQIFRMYITD